MLLAPRCAGEGRVYHPVEHHGPDVARVLLVVELSQVGPVADPEVIELALAERGPDTVKVPAGGGGADVVEQGH